MSEPSGNLGYFWRATAQDPRPIIVHEGIPGHYFQLCLSWKHEDPIRRHYYDSGANEGIGFYAEEMMLQNGLFDDSPHTREIIYNFMRLRALRVEVDVKLALGQFSLEQAAKYLEQKVPMDPQTARQEAIAFSTGPGQAITYQIGKLQITKLLAEARLQAGRKIQPPCLPRFRLEKRQRPDRAAAWEYLGASEDRRSAEISHQITRIVDSGSAGCQPALCLRAACRDRKAVRSKMTNKKVNMMFSASCRKLQAGSLRSPIGEIWIEFAIEI